MGRQADKLFSLIVRSKQRCEYHWAIEPPMPYPDLACSGPLQCAHVVSRRYRSVRWSEDNAMPLCAGAHVAMTHDPLRWEAFVIGRMGAADFASLKARALAKWDGDLEGVLVRLAARAVSLKISPSGK